MPIPNGDAWRHARAKKQLTSDQAGEALDVTGGALRQIEQARKPASLALAYRAAELYGVKVETLLADADDAPPAPQQPEPKPTPPEPKVERTAPPRRKNDRPGPPRSESNTSVGAA